MGISTSRIAAFDAGFKRLPLLTTKDEVEEKPTITEI